MSIGNRVCNSLCSMLEHRNVLILKNKYRRRRIDDFFPSEQDQTSHDLLPQLWFQILMVRSQDSCEFLWEVRGDGRVAISNMGDEVDKVAERDNACVRRR